MKRLEKLLCCLLCVALLMGWPAMMEESVLYANGTAGDETLSDDLVSDDLLSEPAPEVGEILSLDEDKDSDDEIIIPTQGDNTTVDGESVPMEGDPVKGTDVMPDDDSVTGMDEMPDDPVTGTDETTEDDGVVTEGLSDENGDTPAGDAAEVQEGEDGENGEDGDNTVAENAENAVTENAENAEDENEEDEEEPDLLAEMAEASGKGINIRDTFKDDTLAGIVSEEFDDGDGFLSAAEIAAATQLDVSVCGISSMDGIEVLTELTNLNCYWNSIGKLDVSKNTKLTYLDCSCNSIGGLDVSKNTKLTYLDCGFNSIGKLDVSKNTTLTELLCNNNELRTLDISKNTNLTELRCYKNKLERLDITKNKKLSWLNWGLSQNLCKEQRSSAKSQSVKSERAAEPSDVRLCAS